MEDLKKNFVLLSKIAKEKKYAQEYLGLLARRGDLGSIRIGKRWYTTPEWFGEFSRDAEMKKADSRTAETKIELNRAAVAEKEEKEKVLIEKVLVKKAEPVNNPEFQEIFVPVKIQKKLPAAYPVRNKSSNFPILVRNENNSRGRVPYPAKVSSGADLRKMDIREYQENSKKEEAVVWNNAGGFSPSFLPEENQGLPFFPKLALGAALVLLFALLFYGGIVFKKDIARLAGFEKGTVAGAENSQVDLADVKNSSIGFLENRADRARENISLSRVIIRAAMERNNAEIK